MTSRIRWITVHAIIKTTICDSLSMTGMDPQQMQEQIEMIRAQVEAQKKSFREMYASDPAMVEQICSQLDQTIQMQIQMIMQAGDAGGSGCVSTDDLEESASERMDERGWRSFDCVLTESVMGSIRPSDFGYGDIERIMSSLEQLDEREPRPVDREGMRRFGVLLSGIVSTLNGHSLDGLEVGPKDDRTREMVESVLEDWNVGSRDDLIGVLTNLIQSGSTADYETNLRVIGEGGSAQDLLTNDMERDEIIMSNSRFLFTEMYLGQFDQEMLRGWDLGRAANVTRWGYYMGYITEDEAWGFLDRIADECMETFDSWTSFAQSYMFGSMFWNCPWGPEDCHEKARFLMTATEYLLKEGEWKDFPWAEGKTYS